MLRPRRTDRVVRTACALVLVLVAGGAGAACGGSADDDERDRPRVEADDLDLGSVTAEGNEVPDEAGTLANGRAVEAGRIADVVVDPVTVDDRFQRGGLPAGPMASPDQLTRMFSSEDPALFKRRVSGAVATRSAGTGGIGVSLAVLSFTSPAVAASVVQRMAADNQRTTIDRIVGTPVYGRPARLPGLPQVRAATVGVERADPDPSLVAITSSGRMVVYAFMRGPRGAMPDMQRTMARLFTAQLDALAEFEPSTLEQLLGLPVDETGVAALTLPMSAGDPDDQEPDVPFVTGRAGALHMQTWAGGLPEAFEEAELDAFASAGSNVYRAGSAGQAANLLDAMTKAATANQYREHHTPKGLRDARCYRAADEAAYLAPNYCTVQVGRYVAEAAGTSAEEAEARVSAQFLVLQDEVED